MKVIASVSLRAAIAFAVLAVAGLIMLAGAGRFAFAAASSTLDHMHKPNNNGYQRGPTVVLSSTTTSPTNASSIPVTALFSESVNGFGTSSITVTNGTITNFMGSGAQYSFYLTPAADGTTSVQVYGGSATSTVSGKNNQMSNKLTFFSDRTAPVIATVSGVPTSTTNATPSFTFSSNEAGTINLSGGCNTWITSAMSGTTTLTFAPLSNGSYNCALFLRDAAGNMSNTLPIVFTLSGATSSTSTAPMISNISAMGISSTSEAISWTTDVPATGQVFFGPTTSYGSSSALMSATTTSHAIMLTGLSAATLYHYIVVSMGAGGTSTSSDQTFVTQSASSSSSTSTPLSVTGIDSIDTSAIADNTFGNGWKWIIHFVVPDVETFFRMKFADFTSMMNSGTIPVAGHVRYSSPQSSNATSSDSAILETDNNYGGALLLTGDTSSTTPGRQIDVLVETAVPFGTPLGTYSTTFSAFTASTSATSTP